MPFNSSRGLLYTLTMTPSQALDRLLDPVASCFTPETAERIVAFRADPQTQSRIDELADKSNEGQLTDAERREYEKYVLAIDFIAVLQTKARSLLDRTAGA